MRVRMLALAGLAFVYVGCGTDGASLRGPAATVVTDERPEMARDGGRAAQAEAEQVLVTSVATPNPPQFIETPAPAILRMTVPAFVPTLSLNRVVAIPTSTAAATATRRATALPTPPPVAVSQEEVVRGDPSRPWISLVFNAGAGFRPATAVLDTFIGRKVRTTFFLMAWWAEKQPDLTRRISADGHEIASHGYEVFDLTSVSDEAVIADLERADEVIKSITNRSTRPLWSPSAGYRDLRVRSIAANLGFRPIYWTLDSGDWREDSTAALVHSRVTTGAANGAIIVMHLDSPRSFDTIAAVLPNIIDDLRERGFRLVTVSELITGEVRILP